MTTVSEEISKCIPCEVCGNKEEKEFELRGGIENGVILPTYVSCCECNEKYKVKA